MIPEPKDGEQGQADVQDDEVEDLPENDPDDPEAPQDDPATQAEALEDVKEEAAERREDEGGYQ